MRNKFSFALLSLALLQAAPSFAQSNATGQQVANISRVFSQVIAFPFPSAFQPAFEETRGTFYIQEAVLKGQTVNRWTQMITLTGNQGVANNPQATPFNFADQLATNFRAVCPTSFSAQGLGFMKVDGREAFAAVVSCGTVPTPYPHSEATLVLAFSGTQDLYALQWAERGMVSSKPLAINTAAWTQRLNALQPIKVCTVQAGEKAPYPSCINRP